MYGAVPILLQIATDTTLVGEVKFDVSNLGLKLLFGAVFVKIISPNAYKQGKPHKSLVFTDEFIRSTMFFFHLKYDHKYSHEILL